MEFFGVEDGALRFFTGCFEFSIQVELGGFAVVGGDEVVEAADLVGCL